MIVLNKLKWKNFLSTGDQYNELELDASPMSIVVGTNGAGKSTVIDALTYGLFGKSFKKLNTNQLINSVNERDMVVEVFFTIGKRKYHIKRGLKPRLFEIYCGGELLDQDAAARDYQKYLETNILKLNYKSFTQIVVLGSALFVPFMQLSSSDRRIIIEDILDIQVFSVMRNLVKEKLTETNVANDSNKQERGHTDSQIELHEKYINDLSSSKEAIIDELKIELSTLNILVDRKQKEIQKCENDIAELQFQMKNGGLYGKVRELEKLDIQIESTLQKAVSAYSFLKNTTKCPTCEQDISADFKASTLKKKEEKIDEYKFALIDLGKQKDKIDVDVKFNEDIETKVSKIENQVIHLKSEINLHQGSKEDLSSKIEDKSSKNQNLEEEKILLVALKSKLEELEQKRFDISEKICYYGRISNLLQDGGVKTKIIKQYLPVINNRVNHYLKEMDFFVNFYLDENFNETIKSRFRDVFSYSSFSEGEKQRIDIALLLTWRDIAAMRNSVNVNLLIMDEIFDSSLDQNGIDDVLKLFNNLDNTNLFVVSHRGDVLEDKFPSKIYVEKKQNFSTFERE